MYDLRFSSEDVYRAGESWGFNCGPAAICALLHKTPEEIRPFLGDFEKKRYSNPVLVRDALKQLSVSFKIFGHLNIDPPGVSYPKFGLVRIQFGGPWCASNRSPRARHRKTHWIATVMGQHRMVFDVNGCAWGKFENWVDILVPWLIKQCHPDGDGSWWPTHSVDVNQL